MIAGKGRDMRAKLRALLLVAMLVAPALPSASVTAQDAPTRIFVHPIYGFSVEFDWSWEAIPLPPYFGSGGISLVSGQRRITIHGQTAISTDPGDCVRTWVDVMRAQPWMLSYVDAYATDVAALEKLRPDSAFAILDITQSNGWTGIEIVECRYFEGTTGMALLVYNTPKTDIAAEVAVARSVFDTARGYVPGFSTVPTSKDEVEAGLQSELDAANAYWERTFADLGWGDYVPPAGLEVFDSAGTSPCGPYAATESSHYCPADTVIRINYDLTVASHGWYGELDPYHLIGHEVGHHIQFLREVPLCPYATCGPNQVGNPEAEYQASCLLGAFMAGIGLIGSNDEWLLTTTGQTFFYMKEEPIHGDGAENARWFLTGALDGPEACFVFPLAD
jgi:hypothetical protein